MKIAIYSRKSKFTGKGESIDNQIALCQEYAEKHFNPIEDFYIYEDEGFSGGNVERPQFKKMMKDAAKRKFHILICYRLDRISRNISDFSKTIEALESYNISFVSIREHFDTSTPMGRAMMYISSVFAQLERETISERIRDNMLRLARTGRWLGGNPPTGYKSEVIGYYDEEMKKRTMMKLTAIPQEQELVKMLFEKYLELGSLAQLQTWTLQNDIKSKHGIFFKRPTLKRILENVTYAIADEYLYEWFLKEGVDIASPKKDFDGNHGALLYNKHDVKRHKWHRKRNKEEWILVVGKHEGIIQSRDWVRVQEMLEENKNKGPSYQAGENGLITPLLKCSCGSNMRIILKYDEGKVKYYYYKCILKETSKLSKCNIKNINGKEADKLIIDEFKKFKKNKGLIYQEMKQKSIVASINNAEKNEILNQISKYEKAIENLTEQISEGSAATKYLLKKIEEIDENIIALKEKLNSIEEINELEMLRSKNFDILKNLIHDFIDNYDKLDIREQRRLLKSIIKEIIWDGENLQVKLR